MEESKQPGQFPPPTPREIHPADKKDFLFALLILLSSWLFFSCIYSYGFNLGAAVSLCAIILLTTGYLLSRGHRLNAYTGAILALELVICGSFARTDDGFVKFIMVCFLIVCVNLRLCLIAGQNLFPTGGITSLLDAPRAIFMMGIARLDPALRGLFRGLRRNSGTVGKKGGAIALGLLIAVPVLLILVPLLISADAAFDGLLSRLPQLQLEVVIVTAIFGTLLAGFFYVRTTALHHTQKQTPPAKNGKGISPLTVNTVLIAVGVVYVVYLFSQLAYFCGGFSGFLPKDYTLAQYARRGFFDLAWLCAINLLILSLAMGLVRGSAPKFTRLLCLFIGIVTVFLAISASAKMFMYIDSYGLTRLRVLTQIVILWLVITTVLVCLWLFIPRLRYMKAVLLLTLAIGAAVAWADVDTVVARYNVTAYQSGKLETVDVAYLQDLGHGATPYIAQLQNDSDPQVAAAAKTALSGGYHGYKDLRGWNYTSHIRQMYYED